MIHVDQQEWNVDSEETALSAWASRTKRCQTQEPATENSPTVLCRLCPVTLSHLPCPAPFD